MSSTTFSRVSTSSSCRLMAVGVALAVMVLVLGGGQVAANDTQNLNRLLNNQVIVSRQIMCVLEKSPCDQLGRQLKAALPEVIQRNCRNCSPQQAQNAQKLTNFLQTRYPEVWAMLIRKYGAV
ncbi:putative odorant-binding protein A10 [Culex quinquefasciatus]|uniref:putative odorant-binding protein A10 n=1 Tax=Culex quinquefasciatus TaxID=7176 RepID=UPI0018E3DF42|nr:putative odorant-binding protein A10 [Culex quinquefasciatus]